LGWSPGQAWGWEGAARDFEDAAQDWEGLAARGWEDAAQLLAAVDWGLAARGWEDSGHVHAETQWSNSVLWVSYCTYLLNHYHFLWPSSILRLHWTYKFLLEGMTSPEALLLHP
jgi:hypothetical protein